MAKRKSKVPPIPILLQKFITKGEQWNKKSLSHAIYWVKFFLSIILGIILGFMKIHGAIGNLIYLSVPLLLQFYVSSYLGIDIEEVLEDGSAVIKESMIPCYAAFLTFWSLCYTV